MRIVIQRCRRRAPRAKNQRNVSAAGDWVAGLSNHVKLVKGVREPVCAACAEIKQVRNIKVWEGIRREALFPCGRAALACRRRILRARKFVKFEVGKRGVNAGRPRLDRRLKSPIKAEPVFGSGRMRKLANREETHEIRRT